MSKINDGRKLIPAFPREDYQTDNAPGQSGMSLRDYFAAKAMQGMLADPNVKADKNNEWESVIEAVADNAYLIADAMLKAREE